MGAMSLFAAGGAPANRPETDSAVFQLSIAALAGVEPPRLFYKRPAAPGDKRRQPPPVEVPVGLGVLLPPTRIPLPHGAKLWAAEPSRPGDSELSLSPFAQIPSPRPGERWVLLLYADAAGMRRQRFFKASDREHPAGTVRVLNLAASRLAVAADGQTQVVSPGGEGLLKPELSSDGRFPFLAAEERDGQPAAVAPRQLLRLRTPHDRLLVIFAYQPQLLEGMPTHDQVAWVPGLARLYDRAEAPRTAPLAMTPLVHDGTPAAPATLREPGVDRPIQALVFGAGGWWKKLGALELVDEEGQRARLLLNSPAVVTLPASAAGHLLTLRKDGAPLASTMLPADVRQALIMAVAPVEADEAPKLLAFDQSPQSHPPGSRRIFNLTPYQLAYSLGKRGEAAYVNPQEAPLMRLEVGAEVVKLALQTPGGWVLLGEVQGSPPLAGECKAVLVYPEGGTGKFAIEEVSL